MIILLMYVRSRQNLNSITCLLGGLNMWNMVMYGRFWQYLDSVTCLLGSLPNLDFAYVRKVLAEC